MNLIDSLGIKFWFKNSFILDFFKAPLCNRLAYSANAEKMDVILVLSALCDRFFPFWKDVESSLCLQYFVISRFAFMWIYLHLLSRTSQVVLVVKNQPANAGYVRDVGSIAGSGVSPGGGHDNPFQNSCLENPMDRGSWRATVSRVAKSWT